MSLFSPLSYLSSNPSSFLLAWIDISLIVSPRFIEAYFKFLSMPTLRVAACECVNEMILKGMKADAKVGLIKSMQLTSVLHSLILVRI